MKVTIDIDCTPLEARQFLGLPDVQPMQQAVMAEMERRMLAEMKDFSAEKVMASWMNFAPQNAEWMRSMFSQFASIATGGLGGDKK